MHNLPVNHYLHTNHVRVYTYSLSFSLSLGIDVQLVVLIKTLIDPENIMTDPTAVSYLLLLLIYILTLSLSLSLSLAYSREDHFPQLFLQTLHASFDGSTHVTDHRRQNK